MTYYDPDTDLDFAIGEIPPATKWNKIGSNFKALNSIPSARLYSTISQGVSPGIYTDVNFDAEVFDTDGAHSGAHPERLTCATAGIYDIRGAFYFEADATGTVRQVHLIYTASGGGSAVELDIDVRAPFSGGGTTLRVGSKWGMNVGDYVQMQVLHDASGAIDVVSDPYRSPTLEWQRTSE